MRKDRLCTMSWELQIADVKSDFVAAAVIGGRDLLCSEWNVMAAMFMMQSHAAHLSSGGGERRRSSAAEMRSMTRIAFPHAGQRHELERASRVADTA